MPSDLPPQQDRRCSARNRGSELQRTQTIALDSAATISDQRFGEQGDPPKAPPMRSADEAREPHASLCTLVPIVTTESGTRYFADIDSKR